MFTKNCDLENRLWDSINELQAYSEFRNSAYSAHVLGLIFLRYADREFEIAEKEIMEENKGKRSLCKADYHAEGVLFIPPTIRFSRLLTLPENENIGKAVNAVMEAIEAENEELKDALPKTYDLQDCGELLALLNRVSQTPVDIESETFGNIYEYFLAISTKAEGQEEKKVSKPSPLKRIESFLAKTRKMLLTLLILEGLLAIPAIPYVWFHGDKSSPWDSFFSPIILGEFIFSPLTVLGFVFFSLMHYIIKREIAISLKRPIDAIVLPQED